VYYTTLIMDLCRESLDKIPSILGRTIKLLFSRLQGSDNFGMDVECINRFAEFFSHHLSNFGFSWRWSDWEFLLSEPEHSKQFIFVRETLEKCIRLAYFDRIKNSIPETFEQHSGIFPATSPTFSYTFHDIGDVDHGLFDMVRSLNSKISSREEVISIEEILTKIEEYVTNHPHALNSYPNAHLFELTPNNVSQDALFQSIMFQGSKSFSHLLNVIEKYLSLLQSRNETEFQRQITCKIICQFWSKNKQFLEILLGKLVNYRIIDPKSIIQWLISVDRLNDDFDRFYVWNILRSTLLKLQLKQDQIKQRIEIMRIDPDADTAMNGN
jgi:nuclear cap-binding protein subunit 1